MTTPLNPHVYSSEMEMVITQKLSMHFSVEAMGRNYHVYQNLWEAVVGEELACQREQVNSEDLFEVVVTWLKAIELTTIDKAGLGDGSVSIDFK